MPKVGLYTGFIKYGINTGMRKELKEARDEEFARVLALTKKPSEAIKAAEPNLYKKNPNSARVKATRLQKRPEIQDKIQKNLEKLSKKSLKRIDEMLTSDNESIATTNAWKVIEHVRGTPTQRRVNLNASVSIEDVLSEL